MITSTVLFKVFYMHEKEWKKKGKKNPVLGVPSITSMAHLMFLLSYWWVYFLCFKIGSLFVCLFWNQDIEKQVSKDDGVDLRKKGTMRKKILQNLNPEGKYLQMWNMMFVLLCTIAVSVDPLFFYLPVINEDNKCLALDDKLKITVICLRLVTDVIYVLNIILQFLCPV